MNNKIRQNNQSKGIRNSKNKFGLWALGIIAIILFVSIAATEDYSSGERIGFITKFSHKGRFWKSWEGELNLTQTGMNTSSLFDFSIDNDQESNEIISLIDSAVNNGWKVKLSYHQTYFKNWFSNRGETDYFIKDIQILDKTTIGNKMAPNQIQGRIIDTIYVVIDKSDLNKKK